MKITLINPPFEAEYSVGRCRSIKYVLNVIPPLGLAYLAAVLEKDNFNVEIIDYSVEKFSLVSLKAVIDGKPDIVGITASTPTFFAAESIARKIKEAIAQTIIILGGAHITALPYQAMERDCFDIGVIGEGEETCLELARHIQDNGLNKLEKIKGIIFKQDGKCIVNSKREYIKNLDVIPYPARNLLPPLAKYRPTPASCRRLPLGVIMTSRGCPQRCTFCDRAVFGNIYRARSAENVLGEVDEIIHKYGAKEIRFFDDCFALDKERTLQICNGMRKFKIPWTCLTTVGSVTKDLLKEMKLSGCWQVLFGLESSDQGMLTLLKKGATIEQNIQAVNWAKQAGLSVRADFIIGTPGETEESLKKTLAFAIKMELDYAHFNKFVPYPGTDLYRELRSQGFEFNFKYGCSITDHSKFLYLPETVINKKYYLDFPDYAHRRFYLRPAYILQRLIAIRSKDEAIGQLKGFFAISRLGSHPW